METILAAVISGGVSLLVCIITNASQNKKSSAQNQRNWALLEYRLQQLEDKVAQHNNLVSRTYHLESEAELIHEQIKVANHRIEDLEKK